MWWQGSEPEGRFSSHGGIEGYFDSVSEGQMEGGLVLCIESEDGYTSTLGVSREFSQVFWGYLVDPSGGHFGSPDGPEVGHTAGDITGVIRVEGFSAVAGVAGLSYCCFRLGNGDIAEGGSGISYTEHEGTFPGSWAGVNRAEVSHEYSEWALRDDFPGG